MPIVAVMTTMMTMMGARVTHGNHNLSIGRWRVASTEGK